MTNDINQPLILNSYEAVLNLETMPLAEKVSLIEAGFTKKQVSDLKDVFELDWGTLAQLLTVSIRTLHTKKDDDILNLNASDRMLAIAEIYSQGYHLFGDKDLFHDWMQYRNPAFGGRIPVQMMETITGMEEVKNEIQRLKHGGY